MDNLDDKTWDFGCSDVPAALGACSWTEYDSAANDQVFNFQCANHGLLTGIRSIHVDLTKPRPYNFRCCVPTSSCHSDCQLTPTVTEIDQPIQFTIPAGFYGTGFYSDFSVPNDDKAWHVWICKLGKC